MGPFTISILALEDPVMKLIIGVVVLILWGVSALAKAKRAPKGRPVDPPMPLPPPMPASPSPFVARTNQFAKSPRVPSRAVAPRVPSPIARPRTATERIPVPPPLPTARPAAAAPPAAPPVSQPAAPLDRLSADRASSTVLSRLMRPKNIRAQFILAEVFQPPLALRQPRRP